TVGASYEYVIRAADPVFLSSPSAVAGPVAVAGDQAPPSAPTSVVATSPARGTAHVTWVGGGDSDDVTVTYTVTRWAGTTPTVAGSTVGAASGPVSLDTYVTAGGTFTYTVSASDGTFTSSDSVPSAPVVVAPDTATPTVPTGLTATSPAPNSVS